MQVQDFGRQEKATRSAGYGFQKDLDHTPHNLFVEMDELEQDEWVEKARYVKMAKLVTTCDFGFFINIFI